MVIFSGFFEPLFYLFSMGFGVGALIGNVPLDDGRSVPYAVFVAPALLASSAMNGAIYETSTTSTTSSSTRSSMTPSCHAHVP